MKNSKCSVMAAIALCAFVLSAMTLEAQAQSSNRGGRQSRVRVEPLPSPYPIPYSQRVGISPVPNPTARPVPSMEPVGIAPLPSPKPRPGVGRVGIDVGPVFKETENQGEHMRGPGGGPGGPRGQGPRAELPEEVREQLRDIHEMYREAMKIERDIRRGGGEPSEDVLSARNEIVQQIVDSVVDLLDAEVDNKNAPQLMRLLGASFGPKNWRPGGGQGGQGGMGG